MRRPTLYHFEPFLCAFAALAGKNRRKFWRRQAAATKTPSVAESPGRGPRVTESCPLKLPLNPDSVEKLILAL